MSRSASYFENGWSRHGFRDSNQDLLGVVHMIPARARERILDLAATRLKNGGAFHQYQPLTKRGNDGVGSGFHRRSAVAGRRCVSLRQRNRRLVDSYRAGTIRERDRQRNTALRTSTTRCSIHTGPVLGPHGLPLIGRADWNDCLNLNCFRIRQAKVSRQRRTKTAIMGRKRVHCRSVWCCGTRNGRS